MKNRNNALKEVQDLQHHDGCLSGDPDDLSQYSSGPELDTGWMVRHWAESVYLKRNLDGQPDTLFVKLTERRYVGTVQFIPTQTPPFYQPSPDSDTNPVETMEIPE